mgnify:CR=1 FL=1
MTGAPEAARFATADEQQTERLGAEFARCLEPRDDAALRIHLSGDLGAGKTTFVRGFLHALGVVGAVRSPTYGIFNLYEAARHPVLHADLYRLRTPAELGPLGFEDYDRGRWTWLIEWPERAGGALPPADLELHLTAAPGQHAIEALPRSDHGRRWLARLLNSTPDRT